MCSYVSLDCHCCTRDISLWVVLSAARVNLLTFKARRAIGTILVEEVKRRFQNV